MHLSRWIPLATLLVASLAQPARALTPERMDALIREQWKGTAVQPATTAAAAVLVRRLSLDLTGQLPDPTLVERAYASPVDLDRLADAALASRAFQVHWGRVIRTWITARKQTFQPLVNRGLDRWLADHLARGHGLDVLVRQLLTAEGSPVDNPSLSYMLQFRDAPELLAGNAARMFLGAQIQCAQCHDHPFERWKQADFRGFTAFFDEVKVVQWPRPLLERVLAGDAVTPAQYVSYMPAYVSAGFRPGSPQADRVQQTLDRFRSVRERRAADPAALPGCRTVDEMLDRVEAPSRSRREVTPKTLPVVMDRPPEPGDKPPRFLDGTAPATASGERRREQLARWLTDPAHGMFGRCFVNRIFKQLVGRGLVEPADNTMRPDDARFAPALDELAAFFVAGGYRLEPVVRLIVSTRTYRQACRAAAPGDATDFRFQHALARPLAPEVLVGALLAGEPVEKVNPADRRATLEDELVAGLSPPVVFPPETVALTIQDLLLWMNGRIVNDRAGEVARHEAAAADPEADRAWIAALFARFLARRPTAAESEALLPELTAAGADPARRENARTDVAWSVLTGLEFLIND